MFDFCLKQIQTKLLWLEKHLDQTKETKKLF